MATESKLLFIEFKDDRPQMHIGIQATDGNNRMVQDMFVDRAELDHWAEELAAFPRSPGHEPAFQYGILDSEFHAMVRFTAFVHETDGLCGLEIILDNNSARPFQNKAEFCIRCVQDDIRRLGEQILDWDTQRNLMMEWVVLQELGG